MCVGDTPDSYATEITLYQQEQLIKGRGGALCYKDKAVVRGVCAL